MIQSKMNLKRRGKYFLKTKLLVLAVSIALVSLVFVACGNNNNTNPGTSDISNPASTEQVSENSNKSNINLFLDFLISIHEEIPFNFGSTSQGRFFGQMDLSKKPDIVNPITKGTGIYYRSDYKHNLSRNNREFGSGENSAVLIGITSDRLKKLDTNDIVYGCNEENKGMVIAIGFGDGFYLYQIDESGNKTNEKIHYFPEKEE